MSSCNKHVSTPISQIRRNGTQLHEESQLFGMDIENSLSPTWLPDEKTPSIVVDSDVLHEYVSEKELMNIQGTLYSLSKVTETPRAKNKCNKYSFNW